MDAKKVQEDITEKDKGENEKDQPVEGAPAAMVPDPAHAGMEEAPRRPTRLSPKRPRY